MHACACVLGGLQRPAHVLVLVNTSSWSQLLHDFRQVLGTFGCVWAIAVLNRTQLHLRTTCPLRGTCVLLCYVFVTFCVVSSTMPVVEYAKWRHMLHTTLHVVATYCCYGCVAGST